MASYLIQNYGCLNEAMFSWDLLKLPLASVCSHLTAPHLHPQGSGCGAAGDGHLPPSPWAGWGGDSAFPFLYAIGLRGDFY